MEGLNRPILDNTYRLEPKECDRFYPSKVRECIEEIVTKHLADKEVYEHKQAKDLAEKLADERYSGFFLPFRDGINGTYTSPPCSHGLCSPLYHSQDQVPANANFANGSCGAGVPCGEYLFDHR